LPVELGANPLLAALDFKTSSSLLCECVIARFGLSAHGKKKQARNELGCQAMFQSDNRHDALQRLELITVH
jgi:hypothetical protein